MWAKVTGVVETDVGTRDATPHLRGPLNTVKPQAPRARSQWNRYSTVPLSSTRELSVAGAPQRQSGTGRRKLGRVSLRSRSVMLIRFVPVEGEGGGVGVHVFVCVWTSCFIVRACASDGARPTKKGPVHVGSIRETRL